MCSMCFRSTAAVAVSPMDPITAAVCRFCLDVTPTMRGKIGWIHVLHSAYEWFWNLK
jgi:hypothetical protein